jgi:hypothetical protein
MTVYISPDGNPEVWDERPEGYLTRAEWYAAHTPIGDLVITNRQARLALLSAGLLDQVDAALAAIPGDAGRAARVEWEYATTIERGNPLFSQLVAALGLPDDALDNLFRQAAAL